MHTLPLTTDNTEAYDQEELDTLNAELIDRLCIAGVRSTNEYDAVFEEFCDEVSRR